MEKNQDVDRRCETKKIPLRQVGNVVGHEVGHNVSHFNITIQAEIVTRNTRIDR